MRRALVTGASGFIGEHCLRPLVDAGFDVHAVTRHSESRSAITWHQADLLDSSDRRAVIAEVVPTHLLHLAWCTEHGRFWADPANVDWAVATLDLARAFYGAGGIRFVATGTCAEYDWSSATGPLHETASTRMPATLYGQAKLSTQELLDAYATSVGVSYAWAVLFFLIGPGEPRGRLVPSVITALLDGRRARVSAGTQVRDFSDVRDAGRALAALLDSDVDGRVNIGSGAGTSLSELCRSIATRLGRQDLLDMGSLAMTPDDPPRLVADINRLATELSFSPIHTLEQSSAAAIRWWRSSGSTPSSQHP